MRVLEHGVCFECMELTTRRGSSRELCVIIFTIDKHWRTSAVVYI